MSLFKSEGAQLYINGIPVTGFAPEILALEIKREIPKIIPSLVLPMTMLISSREVAACEVKFEWVHEELNIKLLESTVYTNQIPTDSMLIQAVWDVCRELLQVWNPGYSKQASTVQRLVIPYCSSHVGETLSGLVAYCTALINGVVSGKYYQADEMGINRVLDEIMHIENNRRSLREFPYGTLG